MTEREIRSQKWKSRRKRQIRANIQRTILAAIVIVLVGISCHMISNAQSEIEDVSYKYYTSIQVAQGESLWSIAKEYRDAHYDSARDYVDEVVNINHLSDEDELIAGQYLIIPYYSTEYKR